ncbi:MAG: fibrobacter succinogenes major paralogous domain-containing protein, partial [Paludibacter sp.]
MKTIGTLIIALILSCNLASAQDTLYIYRSGVVISQRPVSEIDSITFYRNYDIPVSETVTDIDGNTYHTVKIGTQTWMVENLKTTKYRNGDIIGTTTPSTKDISSESNPKYQWAFNGDESYVAKYGRLYTWYTINDDRKIAPNGWHVATDTEWIKLENYLIANGYNYDGSTVGNYESNNNFAKSLADIKDWNLYLSSGAIGNDLSKNNKTGFTALPAGNRSIYGVFYYLGLGGYWWTSTEFNDFWAWNRDMGYNVSYMGRHNYPNKQSGFSARCIKDSANSTTFPTVTTNSVPFSLGSYSANIRGNVTSDGGTTITSRGLCWNTTGNPTILNKKISAGVGVGEFNC